MQLKKSLDWHKYNYLGIGADSVNVANNRLRPTTAIVVMHPFDDIILEIKGKKSLDLFLIAFIDLKSKETELRILLEHETYF